MLTACRNSSTRYALGAQSDHRQRNERCDVVSPDSPAPNLESTAKKLLIVALVLLVGFLLALPGAIGYVRSGDSIAQRLRRRSRRRISRRLSLRA